VEIGSVVLQMASKKFRHGKKIFLIAPLHHHFEAKGWPSYQVTMRFWLVTAISATVGLIIFLIDKTI
jgi:phospho-N-acetylmuramoyl-pentapeptide-transferase